MTSTEETEIKLEESKQQGEYPLTDGRGFFVNAAVIGEMSTGKSTFLNAIFGDFLAETDIDRTTKTVYRFYESIDADSNEHILDETKINNENQDKKYEKELEKHRNQFFVKKWIKLLIGKVPQPKFYDLPSLKVTESALIPRNGDFDNTLSVIDFPGFNDPELDEIVFETLEKQSLQFDYIFYVMDCSVCLRNKSSQDFFNKTIDIIKTSLINQDTHLIILFNKYDLIAVKEYSKKFVREQREDIIKKLEEKGIPSHKFKFFNISANNLLVQRILLSQDDKFLEKHKELMDDVKVYASEYFSKKEIRDMNNKPIEEVLKMIYDAMIEEKDYQESLIRNGTIPSSTTPEGEGESTPGSGPSETIGNSIDINEDDENLVEILSFLQSLRNVTIMADKAQKYLSKLQIQTYEHLVEFFVCAFCLTQNKVIKKSLNFDDSGNTLEDIMREKLLEMSHEMKNNKILQKQCIEYCLNSLQYCIKSESFDYEQFNLPSLIEECTWNKYLTSDMIENLKLKMETKNEDFYYKIGKLYVESEMSYYKKNNGKSIGNISNLINDILIYYPNDIDSQLTHLVDLLSYYTSEKIENNCRAIDLLQYYFDINTIRKIFEYDQYERFCSKHIKIQDTTFAKLIETMKNIVSPGYVSI